MDITVKELRDKMSNSEHFVLIDVREPHEHEDFNIGGELIPLGNVPAAIPDLEEYKADEIVVYCRSGRRSAAAQEILRSVGFKNVRNLLGGILAWEETFGRTK